MKKRLLQTIIVCVFLLIGKASMAQWQKVSDVDSFPRSRGIAFVLGDSVYLGNGDPCFFCYTNDFEGYTQNGNTWKKEPVFAGPGGDEGFHFVIGDTGYVGDGAHPAYWNGMWAYSPSAGWKQKANPPGGARAFCTGFSIGNKGYFGTGSSGGNPFNDFYEYDPSTNTWTAKAQIPVKRLGCASFSADGYGYIGLGGNNTGATFKDMYRYNPTLNKWDTMVSMPSDTGMEEPGYFVICGKLIVTCGDSVQSGYSTTKQTWMFDPSNGPKGKWTRLQDFPGPLPAYSPTGWTMGDTGFIYGGYDQYAGNLYRQDMYRYVPTPNMLSINVSVSPSDTTVCSASPVTLSATGGMSYLWSTNGTTSNITVSPTDTTSYSVIAKSNGCIGMDTVKVNVIPYPSVTITPLHPTICLGSSVLLKASGASNYQWIGTSDNTDTLTVTPSQDTIYELKVSNGGCVADTDIAVNVSPLPVISFNGNNSICLGDSTTITAGGGNTYSWSNGDSTSSITVKPITNTTYSVSVSNGNCSKDSTFSVIVNPLPVVKVANQTNISCNGSADGSATINASGGASPYTYSWSPSGGSNASASNLSAGTYTCVITDSNGCAMSDKIIITEPAAIVASTSATNANCGISDGSASVSASGGTGTLTYSWTPSGGSGATASGLSAGTYTVSVTDANGCNVTATAIINSTALLDTVCCNATITSGQAVVLSVNPAGKGDTYVWTPSSGLSCTGCSSPVATPTVTTTYYVTITDSAGCSITDSVVIIVKEKCGDLYMPDAFSPNGDEQNDVLYVRGNCIKRMDLMIYDRWGNKVFESTDIKTGWDGTYKGRPMNAGTYVFVLTVLDMNNNTITKKGNVTLVR